MAIRWVSVGLVVVTIAVIGFLVLRGVLFQNDQRAVTVPDNSLKKLGIETPEKKTAAPDFTLEDPAGRQMSLKELRGKVVFLNFWATWCPPCIQEMPTMEKLHQEMEKAGLVILAIDFQESPEEVKEFFRRHNLTFTALLDRDGKGTELYQAWGLPMSAIVNKRGELIGKVAGYRDWHGEEAKAFFRGLLAEQL